MALNSDLDHETLIKDAVNSIYLIGSNHRAEKQAALTKCKLVSAVYEKTSTHIPACVGIWSKIDPRIRLIIRDKSNISNMTTKYVVESREVAKILVTHANTYSKTHYCYVSKRALEQLKSYVNDEYISDEKILQVALKFRSIFEDQERQKIDG